MCHQGPRPLAHISLSPLLEDWGAVALAGGSMQDEVALQPKSSQCCGWEGTSWYQPLASVSIPSLSSALPAILPGWTLSP